MQIVFLSVILNSYLNFFSHFEFYLSNTQLCKDIRRVSSGLKNYVKNCFKGCILVSSNTNKNFERDICASHTIHM